MNQNVLLIVIGAIFLIINAGVMYSGGPVSTGGMIAFIAFGLTGFGLVIGAILGFISKGGEGYSKRYEIEKDEEVKRKNL